MVSVAEEFVISQLKDKFFFAFRAFRRPRAPLVGLQKADALDRLRRAASVFVAYSHSDRQVARRFVRSLRAARRSQAVTTVFFDEDFAQPGLAISPQMIDQVLHAADLFVILCGNDTYKSAAATRELDLALRRGIVVLPVTLRNKVIYPKQLDFAVQGIPLDLLFPFRTRDRLLLGGGTSLILILALALLGANLAQQGYIESANLAAEANYQFINGNLEGSVRKSLEALARSRSGGRRPEALNLAPLKLALAHAEMLQGGPALPSHAANDPVEDDFDQGFRIRDPYDHQTIYTFGLGCSGRGNCSYTSQTYSPDGIKLALLVTHGDADWGNFILMVVHRDKLHDASPGGGVLPGSDGDISDGQLSQRYAFGEATINVHNQGEYIDMIDLSVEPGCAYYANVGSACAVVSAAFIDSNTLVMGLRNGEILGFDLIKRRIIWNRDIKTCEEDALVGGRFHEKQLCTPLSMVAHRGWIFAAVNNGTVVAVNSRGKLIEPENTQLFPRENSTLGTGTTFSYALSDYCDADGVNLSLTEVPSPNGCWPWDIWIADGYVQVLRRNYSIEKWQFDAQKSNLTRVNSTDAVEEKAISRGLGLRNDSVVVTSVRRIRQDAFVVGWSFEGDQMVSILSKGMLQGSTSLPGYIVPDVRNGQVVLDWERRRHVVDESSLRRIWRLKHNDILARYRAAQDNGGEAWRWPRVNRRGHPIVNTKPVVSRDH